MGRNLAIASTEKNAFPFFDLQEQYQKIREEVLQTVGNVLDSQHFILGEQVERLEQEIASYVGTSFAVGCASGTDALYLALCAVGIGPGDEVITTPFTFIATAGSIARTGAKPVFVDISPATFNIDVNLIEPAITEKTRAILPVHLFGLTADVDAIGKIASNHGLAVIEDAAQAIGATYRDRKAGSFGNCGCFSFFPSKNLGCAGDGGMVSTGEPAIADRLRLLRAHGSRQKYHSEILGINSRLDALQAAILRVKLRHLDDWSKARQKRAQLYEELFDAYELSSFVERPSVPAYCGHVFNQYVIRCVDRDSLRAYLQEQACPTAIYYPEPLHLQPAFSYLEHRAGSFPEAEAVCQEVLALPIYPELHEDDQKQLVHAISQFYATRS